MNNFFPFSFSGHKGRVWPRKGWSKHQRISIHFHPPGEFLVHFLSFSFPFPSLSPLSLSTSFSLQPSSTLILLSSLVSSFLSFFSLFLFLSLCLSLSFLLSPTLSSNERKEDFFLEVCVCVCVCEGCMGTSLCQSRAPGCLIRPSRCVALVGPHQAGTGKGIPAGATPLPCSLQSPISPFLPGLRTDSPITCREREGRKKV